MTTAFRRTVERRNKSVWWPLSPTEKSAKRAPFRLIAPLDEMLTAYLAKKLTFATPGPGRGAVAWRSQTNSLQGEAAMKARQWTMRQKVWSMMVCEGVGLLLLAGMARAQPFPGGLPGRAKYL